MEEQIHALSSAELMNLYHTTNAQIRRELIDGKPWTDLKDSLALITELSKEISKRKLSVNDGDSTPADTPMR